MYEGLQRKDYTLYKQCDRAMSLSHEEWCAALDKLAAEFHTLTPKGRRLDGGDFEPWASHLKPRSKVRTEAYLCLLAMMKQGGNREASVAAYERVLAGTGPGVEKCWRFASEAPIEEVRAGVLP